MKSDVPVIFLASDDQTMTEIDSMLLGGDDFIPKPYHPSVLLARVSAVLKRTIKSEVKDENILTHKEVSIDLRTYKVSYKDRQEDV